MEKDNNIKSAFLPQKFQFFLSNHLIVQYPSNTKNAPSQTAIALSQTPSCLDMDKVAPIATVHTAHAGLAKAFDGNPSPRTIDNILNISLPLHIFILLCIISDRY